MSLFEAVIIAIVEGLTEFLPISSTGHMVVVSTWLGIEDDDFTKVFEVAIQLGAILAVVIAYRKKFLQFTNWEFYAKLVAGVLPVLFFGFLFSDPIERMLGNVTIVATSLLVGGIVLLYIDQWFTQPLRSSPDLFATETTKSELIEADDKLTYQKSFVIGLWQVSAMIPGMSRSAASIIGGMQQKLTRNFAAEFSFFLAVPTMCAVFVYSLFIKNWGFSGASKKGYELIMQSSANMTAFAVGNVVAFVVALFAIKYFISILKKYGFRVFGIYRIVVGLVLLLLISLGYLK